MKKYLLVFLLIGTFTNAQNKIALQYDVAGNQTSRTLICINCPPEKEENPKDIEEVEETEEPKEEEETKEEIEESIVETPFQDAAISYYPNPLKEELFIEWREISEGNYVTTVTVYSLSGQSVKKQPVDKGANSLTLPFREYPAGVYIVLISYRNGDERTIKIMKQ
jgi:hypothetical protein